MTKYVYFLPMTSPTTLHPGLQGCQLLDVTGPAAVFGAANEAAGGPSTTSHRLARRGAVASNAGVAIESRRIGGQPDTLLVAGGSLGLKAVMARADVRAGWKRRPSERYGSVCTAPSCWRRPGFSTASGWRRIGDCDGSPRDSPRSRSMPICSTSSTARSGPRPASPSASTWRWPWSRPIWRGHRQPDRAAFVLYARRPGYQSQFSPLLQAQTAAEAPFAPLIDWMRPISTARSTCRRWPAAGLGAELLPPVHRGDRQDAGAFRRGPRLDAARTLLARGCRSSHRRQGRPRRRRAGWARPSSAASAWRRRCSGRCIARREARAVAATAFARVRMLHSDINYIYAAPTA